MVEMSPLRRRMIEDMTFPGLCSSLYLRLPAPVIVEPGRCVSHLKDQVWARNLAALCQVRGALQLPRRVET